MNETIGGIGLTPIEAVLVVGALALVSARWLPARVRRRVAIGAAAVTVTSAAALAVVGLRWQMVPVLVAVVVVLPFTARTMTGKPGGRRMRWWSAGPGSAAGVLTIVAGVGAAIAFPVPDYPTPTGTYAVGTTIVEWTDPDRPETWTTDPDDVRALQAQIWYPAAASPDEVERAQYMGRSRAEADVVAGAFADHLGIPRFVFDGAVTARTNAVPDAPVAPGEQRFPVVLFTPGMGAGRTTNTAWAEELASHGYVVAALDHPYDSAAVVFADGRTVRRPAQLRRRRLPVGRGAGGGEGRRSQLGPHPPRPPRQRRRGEHPRRSAGHRPGRGRRHVGRRGRRLPGGPHR